MIGLDPDRFRDLADEAVSPLQGSADAAARIRAGAAIHRRRRHTAMAAGSALGVVVVAAGGYFVNSAVTRPTPGGFATNPSGSASSGGASAYASSTQPSGPANGSATSGPVSSPAAPPPAASTAPAASSGGTDCHGTNIVACEGVVSLATPDSAAGSAPATGDVSSATSAASQPAAFAVGDVDGDGKPDSVVVKGLGGTSYEVVATLSSGGTVRSAPYDAPGFAMTPRGAEPWTYDIDGDGHAEIFTQVDVGADAAPVGVFRYAGGTLSRVSIQGRADNTLLDVYNYSSGYGYSCSAGALVTRTELRNGTDGNTWTGHLTTYRLTGNALVVAKTGPAVTGTGDTINQTLVLPGAMDCGVRVGASG